VDSLGKVLSIDMCDENDLTEPNNYSDLDEDEQRQAGCDVDKYVSSISKISVNNVSNTLNHRTVVLDSGAGVSIFKNRELVYNVHIVEPLQIDGVNADTQSLYVSTMGTMQFGINVYVSNKVAANILSFGDCVDNCYHVNYCDADDSFVIQPQKRGKIYKFIRDKDKNIYTHEFDNKAKRATVAVNTVRENINLYTKREIAQAKKAREYQRRLGYVTAGTLIKLLAAGKIKDAEITVQDVVRAVNIWGKDLGNLKGKSTAKKTPTVDTSDDQAIKKIVQKQQVYRMDVMFINKLA